MLLELRVGLWAIVCFKSSHSRICQWPLLSHFTPPEASLSCRNTIATSPASRPGFRVKAYLKPDGFVLHHVGKLAGQIRGQLLQVSHDVFIRFTAKALHTHADILASIADLTAA